MHFDLVMLRDHVVHDSAKLATAALDEDEEESAWKHIIICCVGLDQLVSLY